MKWVKLPRISPASLTLIGTFGLWALFNLLTLQQQNSLNALNIVGFGALVVVPGTLVGITAGWLKRPRFTEAAYIVGTSLLALMLLPLASNMLLPYLGVSQPLAKMPLLLTFDTFVAVAGAVAWHNRRKIQLGTSRLHFNRFDIQLLVGGAVLIVLSALGATSLNNGGSAAFTTWMLGGALAYTLLLIRWGRRVQSFTIPLALVLLATALLLMTSLRGWTATGHDIQRESQVFALAKDHGIWQIQRLRDAYNACLSITILPTVFANLLKQPDPYVFKIYFQVLFALTPALIYVNLRRFVSHTLGILSVIYFVALPTFFIDMPMLNRQEIAFVFLGLMLLALFDPQRSIKARRILFITFGLGMVLSHYSTTYSTIAIFIAAYALRPAVFLFTKVVHKVLKKAGATKLESPERPTISLLTVSMLGILITAAIAWTGFFTNTSQGLTTTLQAATSKHQGPSRAAEATNVLSAGGTDPQAQLETYINTVITDRRNAAANGTVYESSTYAGYPAKFVPERTEPLTPLGQSLDNAGFHTASLVSGMKAASPKIIALFAFVGMTYITIYRHRVRFLVPELFALGVASLAFVAAQILLPSLSINYGLLRAYEQALFVLGLFLVIGSFVVFSKLPWKALRRGLPIAVALLYFASNTGLITQLTGGYASSLNLANKGTYYDVYYPHATDSRALSWLSRAAGPIDPDPVKQPDVRTDYFTMLKLQPTTSLQLREGIQPQILDKTSYVLLTYTNVTKQESTILYGGNLITYQYPMQFLDDNKDLLYSTGSSRVYR